MEEAFLSVLMTGDATGIYRLGRDTKNCPISHVTCQYIPLDIHVFMGVMFCLYL